MVLVTGTAVYYLVLSRKEGVEILMYLSISVVHALALQGVVGQPKLHQMVLRLA